MKPHNWGYSGTTCLDCNMSWDEVVANNSSLSGCSGRMADDELASSRVYGDFNSAPIARCECGAAHTSEPDCHSHWCPKVAKK